DNDLVALAYQTPPDLLNNKIALRLIGDGNPTLGHMGTDRGVSFSAVPGVSQALHGYHEFAFKAEYRYDVGMPQWLARLDHALAPLHLERLFLGRHRVHFFRLWYRDELSPFLKEVLLDPITLQRPYFRGDQLSTIVNDHVSGRRNYTGEIH